MNRLDLQSNAQGKLDDAILLLQHRRFSNAYYIAGYAVEIGLKACIARQFATETIPDLAFVQQIHKHDLAALVRVAGLAAEHKAEVDGNPEFAARWGIASEWHPNKRYQAVDSLTAQWMVDSVSHQSNGIMQWIRRYW